MKNIFLVSVTLLILTSPLLAQKVIIYSVKYEVTENMLEITRNRDQNGEEVWKVVDGEAVPEMVLLNLSQEEIQEICESFGRMLMKNYNYSEFEVLYQRNGVTSYTKGRLSGFPQRLLKFTTKKNEADAFVELKLKVAGRSNQLVIENIFDHDFRSTLIFDMTSEFTITDKSLNVIDHKSLYINNFDSLFGQRYSTEMKKDKYKINDKGFFNSDDIINLYQFCESGYDAMF